MLRAMEWCFVSGRAVQMRELAQLDRGECREACCYPEGCAAPCSVRCQCDTRESLSKLERTSPQRKIHVTSKPPVGGISVVTLIRTDTTLDHSQKAEKVCRCSGGGAPTPSLASPSVFKAERGFLSHPWSSRPRTQAAVSLRATPWLFDLPMFSVA